MPLSRYFDGKGADVMADMQERYGAEKGKRVFYATVNKRKKAASSSSSPPSTRDQAVALRKEK